MTSEELKAKIKTILIIKVLSKLSYVIPKLIIIVSKKAKKIYQELGGSSPILKLTKDQSNCLVRCLGPDDMTNGFFVACFKRCENEQEKQRKINRNAKRREKRKRKKSKSEIRYRKRFI